MMNRQKVIKGIDICLQRFRCGEDCPYYNYEKIGCMEQLREDALELLKEQEEQIKNRDESLEKTREEIKWLRGMLKEQEAVVRCKDCKYGYCINPSCDEKEKIYECMKYPIANLRITHKPDWFCADGKQ